MDLSDSPEQAAYRAEVRAWLDQNAPSFEWHGDLSSHEPDQLYIKAAKAWQRVLFDAGLAAITWPKDYGGGGGTPMQGYIFSEEMARFRVPMLPSAMNSVGPTILAHGTEEQKRRFVPLMISGETLWCQLWSEPNAGSDLASLRTRADQTTDGAFVLNGQKVWTSVANMADWGLVLARTDADVPKHKGISCFIIDMKRPGVDVRPLRDMTGRAGFNEVFFDDVVIEADWLVGALNDGWRVGTSTLTIERLFIGASGMGGANVSAILDLVKRASAGGRRTIEDPVIRQRIADVFIHERLVKMTSYRSLTKVLKGGIPGPEGSGMKLMSTRLLSGIAELAMQIAGLSGGVIDKGSAGATAGLAYLAAPGMRIGGGTDEVMRNIIGERVLGLPREPVVDRDIPFRELVSGRRARVG